MFDNDKPQAITSFSAEKTAITKGDEKEVLPLSETRSTQSNLVTSAERSIAYIFDDIHTTFGDIASARDAAAHYLAALRPEDRAAVFTTSGTFALDFTNDRARLQEALGALRPHPIRSGVDCPPLSEYMADLIVNQDDRETLSVATQDAVNCAFGGMTKGTAELARAEQLAKSTAFEVLNASSAEHQSALSVLREVIRRSVATAGRRSIVLISSGFLTITPNTRQSIAELIDSAVRNDIVINTLDVRGLYTVGLAPNSIVPVIRY